MTRTDANNTFIERKWVPTTDNRCPPLTFTLASPETKIPVLNSKEVKIRVHDLSHYEVKLDYLDKRQYAFTITMLLRNYMGNPSKKEETFVFTLVTKVDKIQVVDSFEFLNRCCKNVKPLNDENYFYEKFRRLEYYVNGLLELESKIKQLRKQEVKETVQEKQNRRTKLKEVKKTKMLIDTTLTDEIKKIMNLVP